MRLKTLCYGYGLLRMRGIEVTSTIWRKGWENIHTRGFVSGWVLSVSVRVFSDRFWDGLEEKPSALAGAGISLGLTVVAQPSFGPVPQTHFNQEIFVTKKKKARNSFFFLFENLSLFIFICYFLSINKNFIIF